jgi:uncharacterized small protein (DUF1192 family)
MSHRIARSLLVLPTEESIEELSTAINWDLIQSIDPLLLPYSETKRSYTQLLHDLPLYKIRSRDAKILAHPLAVRFFLIAQAAISELTTAIAKWQWAYKKQESRIAILTDELECERSHRETATDHLRLTEKCITCGKRFLTFANVDAHVARRHPHLLVSWKKLTSDDFLGEDTERIAALQAEIHVLKSRVAPPAPPAPPPLPPREPMAPIVSSVSIQPIIGPYIPAREPISPASSELGTEPVYDGIVAGEDAIAAQAHRQARRDKRQFDTVRECLRVRLAHAVPLPNSLLSDAGSAPEHRPGSAAVATPPATAEEAGDPFLLSPAESPSEAPSSSVGAVPMLVSDSEYDV